MRRKPLFYVFNMILPCLLITLVAMLGFYIPSDSGEKVTMGITTLLSMTVFLMLVAENMPATSDVLPLVGQCCAVTVDGSTPSERGQKSTCPDPTQRRTSTQLCAGYNYDSISIRRPFDRRLTGF